MNVCQQQSTAISLAQNLLALPTVYRETILTFAISTMMLNLKDATEKDEWLFHKQCSSCILFNVTLSKGMTYGTGSH